MCTRAVTFRDCRTGSLMLLPKFTPEEGKYICHSSAAINVSIASRCIVEWCVISLLAHPQHCHSLVDRRPSYYYWALGINKFLHTSYDDVPAFHPSSVRVSYSVHCFSIQ